MTRRTLRQEADSTASAGGETAHAGRPSVLITGASGFLGSTFADWLDARGCARITTLSRRGRAAGRHPHVQLDLENEAAVRSWAGSQSFDAVFHFAATVPSSFRGPDATASFASNVRITESALAIGARSRAAFIYASGTSVYGTAAYGGPPLSEDTIPRPDNWYAAAKLVGEIMGSAAAAESGMPLCALRISAPYGPAQSARTVLRTFLERARRSEDLVVHGSGRRAQSFTFVDDVCEAMWLAWEKRAEGTFNITGGSSVSMLELAELARAAVANSRSRVIVSGEPDPQEDYRGVFDITRARVQLDYDPRVSLQQGLQLVAATMPESP